MTTHTRTETSHRDKAVSAHGLLAKYRLMYRRKDTRGAHPRVPHPGDILYWIGCVGAVSALLFVATR